MSAIHFWFWTFCTVELMTRGWIPISKIRVGWTAAGGWVVVVVAGAAVVEVAWVSAVAAAAVVVVAAAAAAAVVVGAGGAAVGAGATDVAAVSEPHATRVRPAALA